MLLFTVVSLMLANVAGAAVLTFFAKFIHTQVSLYCLLREIFCHMLKICLPMNVQLYVLCRLVASWNEFILLKSS